MVKMQRQLYYLIMLVLAITCIIFPNSMQILSAFALVFGAVFALLVTKPGPQLVLLLGYWLITTIVTLFYIIVGLHNGAPLESVYQVLLIYIVFPVAWVLCLNALVYKTSLHFIVKSLTFFGVISCVTVFVFYYLYFSHGSQSVNFFINKPNINISREGYTAVTMHVFGSMIFIFTGYIASCGRISRNNFLILAVFVFVSLISGRSILILSVALGFLINIFVAVKYYRFSIKELFTGLFVLFSLGFVMLSVLYYYELNFLSIINPVLQKVAGGDVERSREFVLLMEGVNRNYAFGSGHGVGVDYIASELYPWRYEIVWVALLYRVGFLGFLVYALPLVLTLIIGGHRLLKGVLSKDEIFIFSGFVAALVASNTNPYIEGFVFQWMYILPIIYCIARNKRKGE